MISVWTKIETHLTSCRPIYRDTLLAWLVNKLKRAFSSESFLHVSIFTLTCADDAFPTFKFQPPTIQPNMNPEPPEQCNQLFKKLSKLSLPITTPRSQCFQTFVPLLQVPKFSHNLSNVTGAMRGKLTLTVVPA